MRSHFGEVIELIGQRAPLHKKRLDKWLSNANINFQKEVDAFYFLYFRYLSDRGYSVEDAVDAYLGMVNTMLKCQVTFFRTGSYPKIDAESAKKNVYSNPEKMLPYLVGLALSQFLWSTHFKIFEFYKEILRSLRYEIKTYLEIGPGHGLFMRQMLMECSNIKSATAIDISDISLTLTKGIIDQIRKDDKITKPVNFILGDVTKFSFGEAFDFITMGEVLEHVDQPVSLLRKITSLLNVNGKTFLSTCANCPMIDHVVEFNKVGQIKELIEDSGLRILEELALPAENMTLSEAEEKRITINYCALLEKK